MNFLARVLLTPIIITSSIVSGCNPVSKYTGDGKLIDNGVGAATDRYVLNLGKIDLAQRGTQTFRIKGLPKINFVVGLEIVALDSRSAIDWEALNPTIAIKLTNFDGRDLFAVEGPLTTWTWSIPSRDNRAFVYGRDELGTYFDARSNVEYTLAIYIIDPGRIHFRHEASLVLKSGGWK